MKKVLLTLALTSVATFANETTINATMQLMKDGMVDIQTGFLYNSKETINRGISTLENSNNIFQSVNVANFIPNNNKIGVTKNINQNLSNDLKALKEAVNSNNFSEATKEYGKVMHSCVSCHTIIRGW